jgi:hypothetical protein
MAYLPVPGSDMNAGFDPVPHVASDPYFDALAALLVGDDDPDVQESMRATHERNGHQRRKGNSAESAAAMESDLPAHHAAHGAHLVCTSMENSYLLWAHIQQLLA